MLTFVLTASAALTFWSIVYLLLYLFVGDSANFRGLNEIEFFVNAVFVLIIGWMAVGVTFAFTQLKTSHRNVFATCLTAMAVFAYVIGAGAYHKILQPNSMEKKFDRTLYCRANPKAPRC